MAMEKLLWLGGFLLFSNGSRAINNSSLIIPDKPVNISESREERKSFYVDHATTLMPIENKEYPYIKSEYFDILIQNKKSANDYSPIATKKAFQSGQRCQKVLPYRPIYHKTKKMMTFSTKAYQQITSSIQGNKPQTPLKVCHARRFNQSYLRQRSLAE